MKCLRCKRSTGVTTTYQNDDNTTRRRRECLKCKFRFTTREKPEPRDVERARQLNEGAKTRQSPGSDLQQAWHRK